jgi:hypothetical protein
VTVWGVRGAAERPRCPDGANLMPERVVGKMVATI